MEELQIERNMDNKKITITLTDGELEKAYRIMERRYLDEDFANALTDAAQDPDTRFHSGHLEEFPELSDWLCARFDESYDANMSHNDLLALTLGHLQHASLEPQFFLSLARTVSAACTGNEKDMEGCKEGCSRYLCCSIAEADARSRQWELLAALLSTHNDGICICGRNGRPLQCPATKYLTGIWDISAFFHLRDGEGPDGKA